jgi:hypothetical protein
MRFFGLLVLAVVGCGGSLADPIPAPPDEAAAEGGGGTPASPKPTRDARRDARQADATSKGALPSDGPWGTWRLVALEGAAGVLDETARKPTMELELRADGTAYRYFCTDATSPCPAAARFGCLPGRTTWDGRTFRVLIDALLGIKVEELGIVTRPSPSHIRVSYIYPSWSGGRFDRTDDTAVVGCTP